MATKSKKLSGYELTEKLRKTRRRHHLTATEQALFYELVAICNEAEWADVFTCSNEELYRAINVTENTLNAARVSLINAGLIFYQSGKSKRQFSSYSFTNKFAKPATKPKATTSNFDTVGTTTTSMVEGDAATNAEVVAATVTATNAADYNKLQTEAQTKTKTLSGGDAPVQVQSLVIEIKTEPEERKKGSAQKKKDVTPHWAALVSEWFRFYGEQFSGAVPHFNGQPSSDLKQLAGKIKTRVEAHASYKGQEWDETTAVDWLRKYLTRAWEDNWIRNNFLLSNLNSKFDSIVDRHGKPNSTNGQQPNGLNSAYKADLARRMAEASGGSTGGGN